MSLNEVGDGEAGETEGLLPNYLGDDPRPTSKRELAGWYCYGWAAEVFPVCAMGTYHSMNESARLAWSPHSILILNRLISSDYTGTAGAGPRRSPIRQDYPLYADMEAIEGPP
jgi:hypothetical protein